MLAPNYKTAEELKITDEQHAALVKTLAFFERCEVPAGGFTMNAWSADCGSPCCLGGWAEALAGRKLFRLSLMFGDNPLYRLFMPYNEDAFFCTDPAKGAAALRNYLTTGEARWDEVMNGL